jgi:uncharacterized membrane protein YkoI
MKRMSHFRASSCLCIACLLAITGAHATSLSLQDAVAKVERESHGKVLSAETKHNGKRTVYRIKVLTHDGQVRVIEVPADNN